MSKAFGAGPVVTGGASIAILLVLVLIAGAVLIQPTEMAVLPTAEGQVLTTLDPDTFSGTTAVPLTTPVTTKTCPNGEVVDINVECPEGGVGVPDYDCTLLKDVANLQAEIGNKNGASYESQEIDEQEMLPYVNVWVYDADLGSLITADIVVVNGFTLNSKLMEGYGQVEIGQKDSITVTAQAEGYYGLAATRFNLDMSAYAFCEQDKITEFVFYMSMTPDVEPTIEYACERYGQTASFPYDWLSSVEDANCDRALCVNGIDISGLAMTDSYPDWNFEEHRCQWYGIDFGNGGGEIYPGCPEGFIYVDGEGCVEEASTSTSPPGLTTTELDVHNCRWTGHGSGFSVSPCTYLVQHSNDISIEGFWQDAAPEFNWKVGDITRIEMYGSSDDGKHCTIEEYNTGAGWEYSSVRCIELGDTFLGADGDLGKLDNCAGTAVTPWHSSASGISLTDLLSQDPYILDYRQQYSDYRGGGGSGGASVYYDEGGYYFPRDPTCSGPRPNEFRLDFRHNAEEKYLPNSQGDLQLTTDSEIWILIPQYSDLTLFEGGVQDSYEVVNVDGITYYKFNMGRIQQDSSPNVCADPGQAVSCLGGGDYSQAKLNLRKWDAVAGDRRLSII